MRIPPPLRERQFALLFSGRVVSLLGSAVAPIALAFAVLDLTGSATDLGLVLAAGAVTQVLFLVVGGVWSDRLPRNLVIVGSNALSGAVQIAAAVVLLAGVAELWHLVALSALGGIARAFYFPASQGLVPQTVPAEQLQGANALLSVSNSIVSIAGAVLGGLLVAVTSPGAALAFDGATFLVSGVVLALMRLPRADRVHARNFVRELREGWSEFSSRAWLWVTVSQHAVLNAFVFSTVMVLGPLVAEESLGGPAAWGLVLAGQGVGVLCGGLLAMRFRPARPLVAAALMFFGVVPALALLAVAAPAPLIAAAALLSGSSGALASVLWETTVQRNVPPDRLSRVISYDALGSFAATPLGFALVGPFADAVGLETAYWTAVTILVVSIGVQLAPRSARELRAAPPPEEVEAVAA
jgi:MFS family permease